METETKEKIDVQGNELEAKANAKRFFDNYHRDSRELNKIILQFHKRYKHVLTGWIVTGPPKYGLVALPTTNEDLDIQYGPVTNDKSFLEEELV
jgi:hypothetical protein